MKKSLIKECRHILYTRKIQVMALVFSVIFCGSLIINYKGMTEMLHVFEGSIEFFRNAGCNIEEELQKDYQLTVDDNGNISISNSISYYKEMMDEKYSACLSSYWFTQCMEDCLFIFPIVVTVFGATLAVSEYTYKTLRVRAVREERRNLNLAKQIVGIVSIMLAIIVALIPTIIVGKFIENKAEGIPNITGVPFEKLAVGGKNVFAEIVVILVFLLFVFEIAYGLVTIIKNAVVPCVAIVAFWYVVPNMGKFDPRNVLAAVSSDSFPFYGSVNLLKEVNISALSSLLWMLVISISMFVVTQFVIDKRSAY